MMIEQLTKEGNMIANILTVQIGDIVRFKTYALRVEQVQRGNGSIKLHGRISTGGSPLVTKNFLGGRMVEIDRRS